jgi:GntR family transcriptional regulator/MocR family aminotransferase
MASELGISRGVVSWAYGQLAAEGYLITRQGAPVRVSDVIRGAAVRPSARSLATRFEYDLRPGPDLASFPRERWQRSLRDAWLKAQVSDLGDLDPRGIPELRDALASYLDRVRGTAADPELLLICSGFAQGFSLVCRWLRSHGVERIAVEEPGWHHHRLIAEQAGLDVTPVGTDAFGLDVGVLGESGAEAVVVTPAHNFPTGAVMSPERRSALLEWAESDDRLIIEDDYDAELRFHGAPVGALQGLSPERVLYVGSASKRLAPGLRLGWMIMPSWLTWPLVSAKSVEDGGAEVPGQMALADFIARGELDRHLRRMRLQYSRRRRTLLELVDELMPAAVIGDDPAGVFELVQLPPEIHEAGLLAAAARRGVGLDGLSWHSSGLRRGAGILVGYGAVTEPALVQAMRLIGEAAEETRTVLSMP